MLLQIWYVYNIIHSHSRPPIRLAYYAILKYPESFSWNIPKFLEIFDLSFCAKEKAVLCFFSFLPIIHNKRHCHPYHSVLYIMYKWKYCSQSVILMLFLYFVIYNENNKIYQDFWKSCAVSINECLAMRLECAVLLANLKCTSGAHLILQYQRMLCNLLVLLYFVKAELEWKNTAIYWQYIMLAFLPKGYYLIYHPTPYMLN